MANFNAIQIGHLIKAFLRGGTAEQIADRTGYEINTVYRYARAWKKMELIYVSEWKRSRYTGRDSAKWELKTCPSQHDAPKPKAKDSAQRSREYIERKAQQIAADILADTNAKQKMEKRA